jgi:hypothetical protein
VLADSLPLLLKSIRFHYPKKYPQFERIALSQLRKKCGKEKVDEIVARLREMRLARKELKEKHNEMLRKMQS